MYRHQPPEPIRCPGCGGIIHDQQRIKKSGEYRGPIWHSHCWQKANPKNPEDLPNSKGPPV